MAQNRESPWGRVDETGTVYVREGDGERVVGQFPDGSPDEALAFFERKYADLEGQVGLLEQRARNGAPAADVAKAVRTLSESVRTANAVGDLASLLTRLEALTGQVHALTEQQAAEARAAVETALAERTALVEEIEHLAAQDPARVQWKQTTARVEELFAEWQRQQQEGPRLPRSESNELWKRFRAARSTLDAHRRAFFAELDSVHREARSRKEELVAQAEALAGRGAEGIPAYRSLLEDWKRAGRAGKKVDDALWARFKAAGDVLYAAKAEVEARDDAEYHANLERKQALLAEAEPLLTATDRRAAREKLTSIQRRWDEIGRVPRDQVRAIEDRLRRVEAAVRKLEEEHWHRSDPERQARTEGMSSQLREIIARLEAQLADAEARGDARAADEAREALEARRAWLRAIGG